VAVVLALLITPAAMLYLGRPRRAVGYFLAIFICPLIAFVSAGGGRWWPGVGWGALIYVVTIVGLFDAYRIAKWHTDGFTGRWFTTRKGLLGIAAVFLVLLVAIRVFLFEVYVDPSMSMLPSLHPGDEVVVSKLAFRGRLPTRGDLIVFRLPDARVSYVKRVIGLPGDEIVYDASNDGVTINGSAVVTEPLGAYSDDPSFDLIRETMDSRSHLLVRLRGMSSLGGTYPVSPGSYFLLGDNRDNSFDSRWPRFGFVPAANIIGKVTLIWWNDAEPTRAGLVPD
jgi:signal peptidase I